MVQACQFGGLLWYPRKQDFVYQVLKKIKTVAFIFLLPHPGLLQLSGGLHKGAEEAQIHNYTDRN